MQQLQLQIVGADGHVKIVEILEGALSGPEIWFRVASWASCLGRAMPVGGRIQVKDEDGRLVIRTGIEAALSACQRPKSARVQSAGEPQRRELNDTPKLAVEA